ncbi:MAG: hypothetical protein JW787_05980 [Sedimentisphaerales bacterium]|nr:hypothetical protein [Sedimentisphaerales bacterium]
MKSFVILVVLAAIICFLAGCGPGQPFEIEERLTSQTEAQIHVSAAR